MKEDKKSRYLKLRATYLLAYSLSSALVDSGLLEKKIKTGKWDSDRFQKVWRDITVRFANEIRVNAKEEYELVADIAAHEAYMDELRQRGDEWVEADLESIFRERLTTLNSHLKDYQENGW